MIALGSQSDADNGGDIKESLLFADLAKRQYLYKIPQPPCSTQTTAYTNFLVRLMYCDERQVLTK